MTRRAANAALLFAFVAVAAGCDTAKSSNPTSPSVAGPIAGVSITAPKPLEPAASWSIPADAQPITLLIENSSTNGQRAVTYVFEVATDSEFSSKVFSQDGIPARVWVAVHPSVCPMPSRVIVPTTGEPRPPMVQTPAHIPAPSRSQSSSPRNLGFRRLCPQSETRASQERGRLLSSGTLAEADQSVRCRTFLKSPKTTLSPRWPRSSTCPRPRTRPDSRLARISSTTPGTSGTARSFESQTGTEWSTTQAFRTSPLPPITTPVPLAPVGGARTSNLTPEFVVRNATFGAPVGPIAYEFDLAETTPSHPMVAVFTIPQGVGDTRFTLPQALRYSTRYYLARPSVRYPTSKRLVGHTGVRDPGGPGAAAAAAPGPATCASAAALWMAQDRSGHRRVYRAELPGPTPGRHQPVRATGQHGVRP